MVLQLVVSLYARCGGLSFCAYLDDTGNIQLGGDPHLQSIVLQHGGYEFLRSSLTGSSATACQIISNQPGDQNLISSSAERHKAAKRSIEVITGHVERLKEVQPSGAILVFLVTEAAETKQWWIGPAPSVFSTPCWNVVLQNLPLVGTPAVASMPRSQPNVTSSTVSTQGECLVIPESLCASEHADRCMQGMQTVACSLQLDTLLRHSAGSCRPSTQTAEGSCRQQQVQRLAPWGQGKKRPCP